MKEAGVTPSMVDSINSHATSTPAGDLSESVALKKLLGRKDTWDNFDAFKNLEPNTAINDE